jgi:hypothetical protein
MLRHNKRPMPIRYINLFSKGANRRGQAVMLPASCMASEPPRKAKADTKNHQRNSGRGQHHRPPLREKLRDSPSLLDHGAHPPCGEVCTLIHDLKYPLTAHVSPEMW